MNQKLENEFSLLDEEKKLKIMKDIREEIERQKAQYLLNNNNNNNNNIEQSYFPNALEYQNNNFDEPQEYDFNPENENNNFEDSEQNEYEDDNEDHYDILNKAKSSLEQIKNDINKYSQIKESHNLLKQKQIQNQNSQQNDMINNENINLSNNIKNTNSNSNFAQNNFYGQKIQQNSQNIQNNNNHNTFQNNNSENMNINDIIRNNIMIGKKILTGFERKNIDNEKEKENQNNNENYEKNENIYNNNEEQEQLEEQDEEHVNNNNKNNNDLDQNENEDEDHDKKDYTVEEDYQNYLQEEEPQNFEEDFKNDIPVYPIHPKYNFSNPLGYNREKRRENYSKFLNKQQQQEPNYSTLNQNLNLKQTNNKSFDNTNQNNYPKNFENQQNFNNYYNLDPEPSPYIYNSNNNNRDFNPNPRRPKSSNKPRIPNNLTNNNNSNILQNKSKNNNKKTSFSNNNLSKEMIIKAKEKKEQMRKNLENIFNEEHPFKPKINTRSTEILLNNQKNINESQRERFTRLSRPKIFSINERIRQKDEEESKKLEELRNATKISKVDPQEVSNRLYNLHQKLKDKMEKKQKIQEEKEIQQFSFCPAIDSNSKIIMNKYQNKPIYERNEEFERQKTENIIRMRQEIEKEQKERCKPEIDENSRKIAIKKNNNMNYFNNNNYYSENNKNNNSNNYINSNDNVYKRLYKEKINNDRKSLKNREMKECTFTPKLNPSSLHSKNNYYNNNNNYYNDYDDLEDNDNTNNISGDRANITDFLERQRQYEDLKKERLAKRKLDSKDNSGNYSFKPKINLTSDLLAKSNPKRIGETFDEKCSRLYEDAKRIKEKKEHLDYIYNGQYDFIPKINELSKFIGRTPTYDELKQNQIDSNLSYNNINNTNKSMFTNMNKSRISNINNNISNNNLQPDSQCTFKPKLNNNDKYTYVQSRYKNDEGMLERITEEVKNKNYKLQILQKVQQNKDIEECNFRPEINKEVPDFDNNNNPIYMKGMARYLEQMEKARQAKREKEQREKEVFPTGENWSKNNLVTVPKPFKLSYQNNTQGCHHRHDIEMMREEKERNEKKNKLLNKNKKQNNYNDTKNRELIKKLIDI